MTKAAMLVLEDFLASPGAPADSLSPVAIDGYLTAVAIGPELIMPSQWMAGLWGGEPVFEGQEQAQAVLNAVMLRYNEILHPSIRRRSATAPGTWSRRSSRPPPNRRRSGLAASGKQ